MNDLKDKWEVAISHYLKCFNWTKVADIMEMSKNHVYKWTYEKEFQQMLDKERRRIIQENNDRLRSFTEEVDNELRTLILQNNDLTAKLNAIKEFNRKFEKSDDNKEVSKTVEAIEEIRENVKHINKGQE